MLLDVSHRHRTSPMPMNEGAPQPHALAFLLLNGSGQHPTNLRANARVAAKAPGSGFWICAQLGTLLIKLTGAAGFRSLLTRALVLAQSDVPWLVQMTVLPDGRLSRRNDDGKESEAEQVRGEMSLVSHLIGLLYVFVGESLTLQLVKQACPTVCIDDACFEIASEKP
jgi:hypothetical protein